jgi:hypothetical protein
VARELLHPEQERANWAAQQVPLKAIFEAVLLQAREENSVRSDLPLDVAAKWLTAILLGIIGQLMNCEPATLRRELAASFDVMVYGITERS